MHVPSGPSSMGPRGVDPQNFDIKTVAVFVIVVVAVLVSLFAAPAVLKTFMPRPQPTSPVVVEPTPAATEKRERLDRPDTPEPTASDEPSPTVAPLPPAARADTPMPPPVRVETAIPAARAERQPTPLPAVSAAPQPESPATQEGGTDAGSTETPAPDATPT